MRPSGAFAGLGAGAGAIASRSLEMAAWIERLPPNASVATQLLRLFAHLIFVPG